MTAKDVCRLLRFNKRIYVDVRIDIEKIPKRFHSHFALQSKCLLFTHFLQCFLFSSSFFVNFFPLTLISMFLMALLFVFTNSREAYTHHSHRLHTTAATRRRRASRRARTTRTTMRAAASSTSTITRRSPCPSTYDIRNDVLSWTSELRALALDSCISYRLTTTYPRNSLRYCCSQRDGSQICSAQPCLVGWLVVLIDC